MVPSGPGSLIHSDHGAEHSTSKEAFIDGVEALRDSRSPDSFEGFITVDASEVQALKAVVMAELMNVDFNLTFVEAETATYPPRRPSKRRFGDCR
eukprot:COSAG01_NODE_7359_length_3237_cov_3.866794_1_plen_95_part_00